MDVAVGQLFQAGITHVGHIDGEMQGLAGQRMVAVHHHFVTVDLGNGDRHRTLRGLCLEFHADFQRVYTLEGFARHHLDHHRIGHAIAFFGRDDDIEGIALLLAGHLFFKARHDIAGAVQVAQWRAAVGAVDDLAGGVGKGVVEGRDGALADLHDGISRERDGRRKGAKADYKTGPAGTHSNALVRQ